MPSKSQVVSRSGGRTPAWSLGAMRREPAKRFAAAVSRVTLEEVRVNFDLRIQAVSATRVRARERSARAAPRAGHTGPMTEPLPGTRVLAAEPCQSVCVWTRTGESVVDAAGDAAAVFACSGCGSEWLRSELWTPIDADGHVPPEITAELARRPAPGG
jgi:hypothetical protein